MAITAGDETRTTTYQVICSLGVLCEHASGKMAQDIYKSLVADGWTGVTMRKCVRTSVSVYKPILLAAKAEG